MPDTKRFQNRLCHFRIGLEISENITNPSFYLSDLWSSFDVCIVTADVPILLNILYVDKLDICYNNFFDEMVHDAFRQSSRGTRRFEH